MLVTMQNRYVLKDDHDTDAEPIIAGTRVSVRAIVELWRLGTSPEEIPLHLPHINLAQVFDALSYYADHQEEINYFIEINRVPGHLIHPAARLG